MAPEMVGKQVQLLRGLLPRGSRIAALGNPANASNLPQLREAEVAAQALGLRLQLLEAREPDDLDRAFAAMTREHAGGLIVLVDGILADNRIRIAHLAAKAHLPAVYGIRDLVAAGGLMFYGRTPSS
jgi:putative ABC transport system substrate-binding protein